MANAREVRSRFLRSAFLLVAYIAAYVLASGIVGYLMNELLPSLGIKGATSYSLHAQLLLALGLGYLLVSATANVAYWSLRAKYEHGVAAALRSLLRLLGLGGLLAVIAGAVAGGPAAVALGGFIGIVFAFAAQQVLGQTLAGLLILLARPFSIGDRITAAGEEGQVEEVSALFTVLLKEDGSRALLPSNSVLGSKILVKPRGSARAA